MLGINLKSSGRAICTLNHRVISPALTVFKCWFEACGISTLFCNHRYYHPPPSETIPTHEDPPPVILQLPRATLQTSHALTTHLQQVLSLPYLPLPISRLLTNCLLHFLLLFEFLLSASHLEHFTPRFKTPACLDPSSILPLNYKPDVSPALTSVTAHITYRVSFEFFVRAIKFPSLT